MKLVQTLVTTLVVLTIFDVLIWRSVLLDPATESSGSISVDDGLMPEEMPDAAPDAAVDVGTSDVITDADAQITVDDGSETAADAALVEPTTVSDAAADAPSPPLAPARIETVTPPGETWIEAVAERVVRENTGAPVRIKIPSIGVDAAIETVALAADGSMDVPKRPRNVAWYSLGPRPGEIGSAAIGGHVNWVNGAPAVFAQLHKMRPGDKISVQDDGGIVTNFVVREIRRYDAAADAVDVFTSNDGKAHLNLITCEGAWDETTQQYTERLVVFADKE